MIHVILRYAVVEASARAAAIAVEEALPRSHSRWSGAVVGTRAQVAARALRLSLGLLLLGACGGEPERVAQEPAGAVAAEPEQRFVWDIEEIPEEVRCANDADCVETQFSDCCADRDGRCPCEWRAHNREVLEQRQLECGAEECTHGACPACPASEPPGRARCADRFCQLVE